NLHLKPQTPSGSLSVHPGEMVIIHCRSSQRVRYSDGEAYLNWFQQKPGQNAKRILLIYYASSLQTGVLARFGNSGSGTDFTLRISSVEADDAIDYYCPQCNSGLSQLKVEGSLK
uniref:Ig-like domain-containing protein n=1 Tax=Ornithorhynchus anatinus TaxID=9258 RepID=A0A6I8N0R7_ORNAN